MIELRRVNEGKEVAVYSGNDGCKYLLKPVDRQYKGRTKPPRYYLLRQGQGQSKPDYVSGLFPTKTKGELSGDWKDEIGLRRMFILKIGDEGATAEIRQKGEVLDKGGKIGVNEEVKR